jgi:site-specific recombinase XerD
MRSAVFGSKPALVAEGTETIVAVPGGKPIAHLERHPLAVYVAGLAPGSRRTMLTALRVIAKLVNDTYDEITFPWIEVTYGVAQAIRSKLGTTYAPATANRMLAAMKGVLKSAFRLGLIDGETYMRATAVEPVRGSRLPKGRSISQGELRALFGICDPHDAVGARDAALLGLLYAGGLRRAEVVALDLDHLEPETGAVLVRGKGNKQRTVYVTNGALDAVNIWLEHRGREPGPLLLPVLKGGKIEPRRLTDQAVAERLRHLGKKAGVSKFSPHDLRRTFVGDLLDAGADLAVVQALAGHASPTTTARYDRRPEQARRRAAGLLHVPFGK